MKLMETITALLAEGYQIKLNENNRIEFNIGKLDTPMEMLDLSTRVYNGLRRSGYNTIEQIIDLMNSRDFSGLKGVGVKTIGEIREGILEWYWSTLTPIEQAAFIQEVFV